MRRHSCLSSPAETLVNLQQNGFSDAVWEALGLRTPPIAVLILSSSNEPTRLVGDWGRASAYILAAELLKSALIIYSRFSRRVKVSPISAQEGPEWLFNGKGVEQQGHTELFVINLGREL